MFFLTDFREERERIMDKYESGVKQADFDVPDAPPEGCDPKLAKSHNAIVFQAMARVIADRWKNLDKSKKVKYEAQAAVEMKTYRARMQEYEQRMIRNSALSKRNEERQRMDLASSSETAHAQPNLGSLSTTPMSLLGCGGTTNTTSWLGGSSVDTLGAWRGASQVQQFQMLPVLVSQVPPGALQQMLAAQSIGLQTGQVGMVPGQDAFLRLQQQLQLEQDLQNLARLRAQQPSTLPPPSLTTTTHSSSRAPSIAGSQQSQGSGTTGLSDVTSAGPARHSPEELPFLRTQALLNQRQSFEWLLLQQQFQQQSQQPPSKEALERLLRGAGSPSQRE